MKFVVAFTHANTNREILVAIPLVFSAYYSETSKCTHVLSNGGAIIPVTARPEDVMGHVKEYLMGVQKWPLRETQAEASS